MYSLVPTKKLIVYIVFMDGSVPCNGSMEHMLTKISYRVMSQHSVFHSRAHLNDLENIPTFLIVALIFMLANLSPTRGIWCLRIFTAARILHTVAYLAAFSKPRALGFLLGSACIGVLCVSVLVSAVRTGY